MRPASLLPSVALLTLPWGCAVKMPDDVYLTNHDVFDLTCSAATNPSARVLHIEIDARGQFKVFLVRDGGQTAVETVTYTNAVTWTEGNEHWTLDRFKGTLESKSTREVFACDRAGGRRL